ncbi:MAG: signal recognition particle protein [Nitrospirae bacterium]|nr:signal recognition particle protein [Nitrospirota bacterium]
MLESLSEKLEGIFKRLKGRGVLKESDVEEGLREVRLALLEADVHFRVVKAFIEKVKERAVGQEVLSSLTPGQQVVKIVYEELCRLMGEQGTGIRLSSIPPTIVMLVGLQGSGKTTTSGKLAKRFKSDGRRVLLTAADPRRPAAVQQLTTLGESLEITVHAVPGEQNAVLICQQAVERARSHGYEVVILDTAGRLHIDTDLMEELRQIRETTHPHEILLVADAMTGQDAVNMAARFHEGLGLTGAILTKVDGDARGGAVLSIRHVTGVPVKFLGVGEKLDQLEPFHPDRMASRILGMGDVLSLIEKAQETTSKEEALALQKKMKGNQFTLEDFRDQLGQIKKLGSLEQILQMIPGGSKLLKGVDTNLQEREFRRLEGIINSMTPKERRDHTILNGSRRKRIARGSGTKVEEVNRLLKQFVQAKKMMKVMGSGGKKMHQMKRWLGVS